MLRKYCRYSTSQLQSLGLNPDFTPESYSGCNGYESSYITLSEIACGKFRQIIDVLYSSDEVSLSNNLQQFVSDSAPIEIQSFVKNVLLCPIQALKSAPDDDTAFDMIIPRSAQDSTELRPYLDVMRKSVVDARQRYIDSQQPKTD